LSAVYKQRAASMAALRLRVVASLVLRFAAEQQRLAERFATSGEPRSLRSKTHRTDAPGKVFAWLTNPLVRLAVWGDDGKTALVSLR
jgi:hypothetical protein